eukprot:1588009-Prymnesium_polylepis.1
MASMSIFSRKIFKRGHCTSVAFCTMALDRLHRQEEVRAVPAFGRTKNAEHEWTDRTGDACWTREGCAE